MGFFKNLWGRVREGVSNWLRSKKLEDSVLMDAWVGVNKYVDAATRVAKSALKGKRARKESQKETVVRVEQIKDPEVRARARQLLGAESGAAKRRKRRVAELIN